MTHIKRTSLLAGTFALATIVAGSSWSADPLNLSKEGPDWATYHGTYNGYHYSPLDQINASNIKQLKVAWMHQPGKATRGLQSFPLVANGMLFYTGSYSRVFALDAATGEVKWTYFPKLDDDLVAQQTHSAPPSARASCMSAPSTAASSPSTWRPESWPGTPSSSTPRS
jgi:glucose dehydrogenase